MKKYLYILVLLLASSVLKGQNQISVAGIIMDEQGLELIGVSIVLKSDSKVGTVSDFDGRFKLDGIPAKSTLIFSYVGYQTQEVYYSGTKLREQIVLKEDVGTFDELVVTGRGSQRKASVVGAITTVEPEALQVPAVSVSNMLGGRVPGIIAVTRSGEPGNNFSEFWIRGISTFGASQSALVLIDGVEGNINTLDPADIESFSILKDASATAVYGTRGANGVVVITTKRGKAGRLKINFKTNATYSYSPRMPEYADGYDYALLANEARAVRGDLPLYTNAELELYKTGLDPDLYPNVNWRDVMLKNHVWNHQHHLSISGGGQNARYYMSLGILNSEAIFKTDKSASKHDVNVDYNKYNFRANIDANLTKTTELSLNLEAVVTTHNAPGNGSDNQALWNAQANLPPIRLPVRYSNGQLPVYGSNSDQMSPYVRLNYTGYTTNETYTSKATVGLKQDLNMVTSGLSLRALFSLNINGNHEINRSMRPDLFYALGRYNDGSLRTERRLDKQDMSGGQYSKSNREFYFEVSSSYNRLFNEKHRVSGFLHFYRQEKKNSDWRGLLNIIPRRYQAISGRATYAYKDIYLLEGNLGYTGTENFDKGHRYGWFPSIAAGWLPSEYDWFKDNLSFITYLKFRASYGKVGNDRLKDDIRFPYLTIVGGGGNGPWGGSTIHESQIGAEDLRWETTTKKNFGIDGRLFDDKVDFTVDFFESKTTGIFQKRANIPEESGLNAVLPYTNIGSMKSWGMDGNIAYSHRFNKDMSLTVRGNLTYSKNEILYWEQSGVNYPYQAYVGAPLNVQRGLIALGLFKDEDDIISSPRQTFRSDIRPGDIKYKDVNGDGIINEDDEVPLSFSAVPQIQYGFAAEFNYKNLTVSAFFEGVGNVEYMKGIGVDKDGRRANVPGYYPFAFGETGNLLSEVVKQGNRWTPASYSGDPSTENPNAKYPRLTYGANENNNRSSTFWLANGRYFRLKNVEVSYRFASNWLKSKLGIEAATLSVIGDNLHVWDKVKLWDPGQASANGGVYPLQRLYTIQLFVTF